MNASIGPLAVEATQLLDVLAGRLEQIREGQRRAAAVARQGEPGGGPEGAAGPSGDGAAGDGDSGDASSATGRCPQCGHDPSVKCSTGCPWCAAMALLRGERPESAARLVDGALTVVQALRGLLAGSTGAAPTANPAQTEDPAGDPAPADDPAQPGAAAKPDGAALIRIDVE